MATKIKGIISQSAEVPKRPGLPPSTSAERLKGAPCLASPWHRHESDVVALSVNPYIWDNGIDIREEIRMDRDSKVDPAAHQPSKAELEEDVGVNATPEALGWAVTRGGAEQRDKKSRS